MDLLFLNDEYDVLFHEISIGHVSFKDLDMNENHLSCEVFSLWRMY